MIYGLLLVLGVFTLFFGLNVIVRQVMVRGYLAQTDVVAQLALPRRSKEKIEVLRLLFIAFWVTAGIAGLTQSRPLTLGVIIAFLILAVLWPLYVRGKTRTTELLYFDSKGMTIFPARTGMLHEGAFQIRIDWKDTFGYTVYKGNVLFSLLPSGYVEQHYGDDRLELLRILDRLGIRKLVAYDVLQSSEVDERGLQQLEERVETMVRDVVAGYLNEFASLGIRVEVGRLNYEDEGEEAEMDAGAYALARAMLYQDDQVVQELEWLVWEKYDDLVEVISLPEDRLYETLDDRLQAVLTQKMRDAGLEPRKAVLQ